tara:strand:- start:612 stop:824 length:213 start_codon:yes stop_codon:yes gene_type:complete
MPQQEQIDKLSKKDCIENIKLFKIEIKKAERFYREELQAETKYYLEGIERLKKRLIVKFNVDFDELEEKK